MVGGGVSPMDSRHDSVADVGASVDKQPQEEDLGLLMLICNIQIEKALRSEPSKHRSQFRGDHRE